MTLFLNLALRNLVRNRVRTFLNLTMIVGAFSSIVIFRGFAHYILTSTEEALTLGQNGHIQIATAAVWKSDLPKNKQDAFIPNHEDLEKKLSTLAEVEMASGRANAYSLLISGDKSVGAVALGFHSKKEHNVEKALLFEKGDKLSGDKKYEVLVSAGLEKNLKLKMRQSLSVVSQTLGGSMSSVDLEVRGVVRTGMTDLDNSIVFVPLEMTQKLLGTDRVERIVILLKRGASLEESLMHIRASLKDYPQLVAKDWKETATIFRQLTDFYNVQNTLIEVILASLVFFGILNTLGMSIYERIGEIGTLRALGDRIETVIFQLALEGLLLGVIGSLIAVPIAALISFAISSLEILLRLPGGTIPIPLYIRPIAQDYWISSAVVILTCFLAIFWPARKAVKLSIVDALRANS